MTEGSGPGHAAHLIRLRTLCKADTARFPLYMAATHPTDELPAMTSSGTLSIRRKKALYRAQHRGMREMDILLGTFATAMIDGLSGPELDQFEHLLDQPDGDFFKWLTGEQPVPPEHDSALFRRIQAFRQVMPF